MEKTYLNAKEIIKLKANLMPKKKFSSKKKSKSSLSSEIYKIKNYDIGIDFEENVRKIMEIYYGWKKVNIERKIVYREIYFEEKFMFITNIKNKQIKINGKYVNFTINKDKSLDIEIDGKTDKIREQKPVDYDKSGIKIVIGEPMEFELDGIYEDFDFSKFNKEEISLIWENPHNLKINSFKKVVLEIKLNKNKINDLLYQLIRDRDIIEFLTKDEILYIGVVNSKSVNFEEVKNFSKKYANMNFVLLGIKNSKFGNKNITKYHDWEEIQKVLKIEERLTNIEDSIKIMKNQLTEIIGLINQKRVNRLLKKKRKRGKESVLNPEKKNK